MATTVANPPERRPRVLPEMTRAMLKADLREPRPFWKDIGRAVDTARHAVGWTIDELAGQLPPAPNAAKRDPRQVARWIRGEERLPLDVVWAVPQLRGPLLTAFAELAGFEVETKISIRRSA